MSNAIEVFDSLSARYEEAFKLFLKHTDQKVKANEWLERFVATLPTRETLIDVGAGTGVLTRELAKHFKRSIAIEPNASLLSDLRANAPQSELFTSEIGNLNFGLMGDLVLCSHVLYYVNRPTWQETLEKLATWTSSQGSLIVILQNANTDCQNMLRYFSKKTFDLQAAANDFQLAFGHRFHVKVELVPSYIETDDLEVAYRIAEFVMNLAAMKTPPTADLIRMYVQHYFRKPEGGYRFSCHQDFLVITRK